MGYRDKRRCTESTLARTLLVISLTLFSFWILSIFKNDAKKLDSPPPSKYGAQSFGSVSAKSSGQASCRSNCVGEWSHLLQRTRTSISYANWRVPCDMRLSFANQRLKSEDWPGDASASAFLVCELSRIQHSQGMHAAVGEIGVQQENLFLPVAFTSFKEEGLVAVSLFQKLQEADVENAGRDGQAIFRQLLAEYGIPARDPGDNFKMIASGSQLINDRDILDTVGPLRLISIDSEYTTNVTECDLWTSACVLIEGGIVIVDDFFLVDLAGVSEGFYRYLAHKAAPKLSPFLVAHKKVYLTTPAYVNVYRSRMAVRLREPGLSLAIQEKTIAGSEVLMVSMNKKSGVFREAWLTCLKD